MRHSGLIHARSGMLAAILAGTGGFCESPLYMARATAPGSGRGNIFNCLISKRNFQKDG
jgi:hypothetical protein